MQGEIDTFKILSTELSLAPFPGSFSFFSPKALFFFSLLLLFLPSTSISSLLVLEYGLSLYFGRLYKGPRSPGIIHR